MSEAYFKLYHRVPLSKPWAKIFMARFVNYLILAKNNENQQNTNNTYSPNPPPYSLLRIKIVLEKCYAGQLSYARN